MTTDERLRTYQVTDRHATLYRTPMGPRLRGMALDSLFQGRPAPGRPDWIMRTEDGWTPTGYVLRSVCSPLDLAAHAWAAEGPPAPRVRPDLLGDATAALGAALARGRTGARAKVVRKLLGDFAAELINRATAQAASVTMHLFERQERDRARIAALEGRVIDLEGARERAVGE